MWQLASSLPFPYYKRQTTFLQTFGIPEINKKLLFWLRLHSDEILYFGPILSSFFGWE
jgi:hypothetical protein